jgi:magnesium chelatase subunit D
MSLAAVAAALLAVDPVGLGGIVLRTRSAAAVQAWLDLLASLLPDGAPLRRLPAATDDAALLGGLDLAASLQLGRPSLQPGLLARCDGGVLVVPMAERLAPELAARLAAVLDRGVVYVQRDGLAAVQPARLALVAIDEGADDDEHLPVALGERLALHLVLAEDALPPGEADAGSREAVLAARERLGQVSDGEALVPALCEAAQALGVDSLRGPWLALRLARAAAALDGRDHVEQAHADLAAQLVLGPRATRVPQAPSSDEPEAAQEPDPPSDSGDETESAPPTAEELAESVLAAAQASLPSGLLAALALGKAAQARGGAGRAGALQRGQTRGRPVGSRRARPRGGLRLHLIDTLRAAAPWQPLRAREWAARAAPAAVPPRVHVRTGDFHVRRLRQRSRTTTIFVVDASGSSALHRLAEAKGAVELMLADCYVRRDQVAVIAFRGSGAELVLPPTRSLARAKRSLAGLPGGGGTPLASALDAAQALAAAVRRKGEQPVLVVLTDGRANIARDGNPGRQQAGEEALAQARRLRADDLPVLLVDTAPQPQATARALAEALGASYLPLPHAGAAQLSAAVQHVAA